MDRLNESDTVRIVRIEGPGDTHDPADLAPWRVPVVGDIGTVLHLTSADGKSPGHPDHPGTRYLVRGMNAEGRTEWLAEFSRNELELVGRRQR